MSSGFSKSIGTVTDSPISIQVPEATGDDVSDVLNVASFALNTYNQFQANKEQKRVRGLIDQSSQDITDKWQNAFEQTGSVFQANKAVNREISALGDPSVSQAVATNVAERIRFTLQGVSMDRAGADKEQQRLFNTLPDAQKAALAGKVGIKDFESEEAKMAIEDEYIRQQQDAMAQENNKTLREQTEMGEQQRLTRMVSSTSKMVSNFVAPPINSLIGQVKDLKNINDSTKQAELVNQIRSSVQEVKSAVSSYVDSEFAQAGFDLNKMGAGVDRGREQIMRQIDNISALVTSDDFGVLADNMQMLEFLQNKMQLDSLRAGDIVSVFKAKYGHDIARDAVQKYITGVGPISEAVELQVGEALRKSVIDAANLSAQDGELITLESVMEIMTGNKTVDDVISLVPEDKAIKAYQEAWRNTGDIIKTGSFNAQGHDVLATTKGLSFMLEAANADNTAEAGKVVDLMRDPNYEKFVKKADASVQPILGNQALKFNERWLRNNVDGSFSAINEGLRDFNITYDASTGKFSIGDAKEGRFSKATRAGSDVIEVEDPVAAGKAKARLEKQIQKINDSMDLFVKNKDASPSFKDFSDAEVRSFLLQHGSGLKPEMGKIKVKGSLADISKPQQQAVEEGVSLKELEAKEAKIKQLGSAEEQAARTSDIVRDMAEILRDAASGKLDKEALREILKENEARLKGLEL